MIIDTHCHLIDEAFTQDVEACILNATTAGVAKMMLACCDETEYPLIKALCTQHPGTLFASIGIHPENMAEDISSQLRATKAWLDAEMQSQTVPSELRIKAIGEIGIDLHWDKTRLDNQLTVLTEQLNWALEYDLPVLLHIRDAMPEFLQFLHAYIIKYKKECEANNTQARTLRGILHCYSGTLDEALAANELADLYIGIGGTVTYKKSKVPEVAKAIGLNRIVLETDAPYLAPVPERGHRNEPAFTAHTARYLANIFETTAEEVAEITTANACKLLGI